MHTRISNIHKNMQRSTKRSNNKVILGVYVVPPLQIYA